MWWLKTLLIGCIFVHPSPGAQKEWTRIQTDQEISFLFPSPGEQKKQETGDLKAWIYETANSDCLFGVVCTPSPLPQGSFSPSDVLRIYNQLRDGSVDMPDAVLKEEKRIPAEGMRVREIRYTVLSREIEFTYYKRFIFRGNYIYQLTVGGATETFPRWKPYMEKFFASIAFANEDDEMIPALGY